MENVMTSVSVLPLIMLGVYQISKQIKAHDGSVFTLCQMRNGMLLTGGGKDRKIDKTEVVLLMYKKYKSHPERLLCLCLSSKNFITAFHDGN